MGLLLSSLWCLVTNRLKSIYIAVLTAKTSSDFKFPSIKSYRYIYVLLFLCLNLACSTPFFEFWIERQGLLKPKITVLTKRTNRQNHSELKSEKK